MSTPPLNVADPCSALPYRGTFGSARPAALQSLALPPRPMPARQGSRPLKSWRYVGVYGPELMLCIAAVRIGPARQCFWAVWDRARRRLYERTRLGRGGVELSHGRARVTDEHVEINLALEETGGVETVCASGASYAWTRKQGGVAATGTVVIDGSRQALNAHAVIDDTAGYYERHTRWHWSAGVGTAADGRPVAWNLVEGVNDPEARSERTVWIDGQPREAPTSRFAADLSGVDRLRFEAEATRERKENLGLIRSEYRQPFGAFSGELPGGVRLAQGYGVMESHDVRW